jgi:hypothetical protein
VDVVQKYKHYKKDKRSVSKEADLEVNTEKTKQIFMSIE